VARLLLKLSLIVFFAAGVFGALFANYVGYFKQVEVTESDLGPLVLVYLPHQGTYQEAGKSVAQIARSVHSLGIQEVQGFALFNEEPGQGVELSGEVGVILKPADLPRTVGLLKRYQTREFPKTRAFTAEFPSQSSASLYLGQKRVYPLLRRAVEAGGQAVQVYFEVYDFAERTRYYTPAIPRTLP
jgi:AraC family transcriptional regulator